MIDAPETTQTLALLIGLYLLSGGLGLLLDRDGYAGVMTGFLDNPAVTYLGGVVAFVIGGAIVAVHDLWTGPAAIVISLVGWISLIEGALLIAFRPACVRLLRAVPLTPAIMMPCGIAGLLLGVWLLYTAVG